MSVQNGSIFEGLFMVPFSIPERLQMANGMLRTADGLSMTSS